jgi:ABC-type cobalamin/Fe3+-siderophores transport system ATPase subunit
MIRKIELVNFMSHAHTVIEPGPGLNVLIGPNNCGKSAVFVALRCAVRRIADDFMVRHDQKFCEVTLTMADGTIVGFRRRKTPTFRLNDDDGMGFSAENAAKLVIVVYGAAAAPPIFSIQEAICSTHVMEME